MGMATSMSWLVLVDALLAILVIIACRSLLATLIRSIVVKTLVDSI